MIANKGSVFCGEGGGVVGSEWQWEGGAKPDGLVISKKPGRSKITSSKKTQIVCVLLRRNAITMPWNVRFKAKYPCNIKEITQQTSVDRNMINVFSVVFYEKVRSVYRKVKFDGNLFKRNLPQVFFTKAVDVSFPPQLHKCSEQ